MRRWWPAPLALCASVLCLTLAVSCGKDKPQLGSGGGGGTSGASDGGTEAGTGTAGRMVCLDRPTDLPRTPGDGLPCELIPPGLTLAR